MRRGWFNTTMGVIFWGFGSGLIVAAFNWPWGAQIGFVLVGIPFILFMFGKEE